MILIDIQIPAGCYECPCMRNDSLSFVQMYQCNVTQKLLEKLDKRPLWCPLKGVQE